MKRPHCVPLVVFLAATSLAFSGCALIRASDEQRLAEAIEARYPAVVASAEPRSGNFLDRPTISLQVARDVDRAELHRIVCVEVPRVSAELGISQDIGIGAYTDQGDYVDGGSSMGCP